MKTSTLILKGVIFQTLKQLPFLQANATLLILSRVNTPEMQDILQKQLSELRHKALAALRTVTAPEGYECLFTFIALPSFDASWRLTIYVPESQNKGKLPLSELCIWHSDKDFAKIAKPVAGLPVMRLKTSEKLAPTLEMTVHDINLENVDKIGTALAKIQLSPYVNQPAVLGVDGTSYEFYYGDFWRGIRIHWWEDGPEEWKSFISTVRQTFERLKREFGKSTIC